MLGIVEIFSLLLLVVPVIICLVDILKSEFTGYNKIIWVILVVFLNLIGVILYAIIGRKQKVR